MKLAPKIMNEVSDGMECPYPLSESILIFCCKGRRPWKSQKTARAKSVKSTFSESATYKLLISIYPCILLLFFPHLFACFAVCLSSCFCLFKF